jgi:hypothetical protein
MLPPQMAMCGQQQHLLHDTCGQITGDNSQEEDNAEGEKETRDDEEEEKQMTACCIQSLK